MLLNKFSLFFIFYQLLIIESKKPIYFVYSELDKELIFAARKYGADIYDEYLNATENMTQTKRQTIFPDYFEKCNSLGWEYAQKVINMIKIYGKNNDALMLAKIGFPPFVAKVLTLNSTIIEDGIKQMCSKTEIQFQCQLGFGESRAQILKRIQNLKNFDGNFKLLLTEDCKDTSRNMLNYPCIGHNISLWAAQCEKKIESYNSTRITLNDEIYRIHLKAVEYATKLAKNASPDNSKQFIPTEILIENVLRKALKQIVELESQKCRQLNSMLKCILPKIAKICGNYSDDAVFTSITVGYLRRERSEALQTHFEQLEMDNDPICLAINSDI